MKPIDFKHDWTLGLARIINEELKKDEIFFKECTKMSPEEIKTETYILWHYRRILRQKISELEEKLKDLEC